jgi:hypothetical protein
VLYIYTHTPANAQGHIGHCDDDGRLVHGAPQNKTLQNKTQNKTKLKTKQNRTEKWNWGSIN